MILKNGELILGHH